MGMKISYQEGRGCLIAKVSGQWGMEDTKSGIVAIRDEADKCGLTRMLIDVSTLALPDTEMTRFVAGEQIAKFWCPPFKVAALVSQKILDGFTTDVAVNRGATFESFLTEEEAFEWLLDSPDEPEE